MTVYLFDSAGALVGPVELDVIPGGGVQLPSNAVDLGVELEAPAAGFTWALVDGEPVQLADHRGTVYRTDTGTAQHHSELGQLPVGLTAESWPGRFYIWVGDCWMLDEAAQLEAAQTNERAWRNAQISATDYLAMPDYPINEDQRAELYAYRQALRNWPEAGQFPEKQNRPRPAAWIIELIRVHGVDGATGS